MYRTPFGSPDLISDHSSARRHWTGSNKDKYEAAEEAAEVFNQAGIDSCVFGSLAFKLLGIDCKPGDVDLIVLDTTRSLEELKEHLVEEHPQDRFYLIPSRFRHRNYRVLWYATRRGARVKVDILQPGEMSVPHFEAGLISQETPPGQAGQGFNIPVAPLEVVLLLKLRGWIEHRQSNRPDLRNKEPEDVKQMRALLVTYKRQFSFGYLSNDFIDEAEESVQEYVREYPSSRGSWRFLGLYN